MSKDGPLPTQGLLEKRTTLALLLATIIVRTVSLVLWPDALAADPDGYRAIAENLVQHQTFGNHDSPTAYRPPLYPLLLVPCVAMASNSRLAIGALHVALGLATVWFTYRLGRTCGLERWAWWAALLVALDPILLAQSALVMTETLAAFLAVASLVWIAQTGRSDRVVHALAAGAFAGLAILCRPTFLPWACAAGLLFLVAKPAAMAKARLSLAFVGAMAVVVSPWAVRNQIHFGRPIVTTTHGGYTLLLANNPFFYEHLRRAPWGTVWRSDAMDRQWSAEMPRGSPREEIHADRLAYAKAIQAIRNEPEMFCYACLVRIGRLFSPLPHQTVAEESMARRLSRYAVGIWYTTVLALAVIGASVAARRWRDPSSLGWVSCLLLVVCFTAVHTLYWTDMRMRAPLMPAIAAFAAAGTRVLWDLTNRRKVLRKK